MRELGYRVLEAHDGPAALRLLERQEGPIDLLFTDVVMPEMTGSELAAEARKAQPGLRVLYTSGYTRNAIVHGGRLDPGVEVIVKPFTFEALAQKVRDQLDAGRTKCVLIVEGEPAVRILAAEVLRGLGLRAEEAATGSEALNKVRAAQGSYDAVILEDVLTDISGEDLRAELRALHAQLPLVVTVREQAAGLRERLRDDRCTVVIPRPYSGAELQEALQKLSIECDIPPKGLS
nr:response regulator [Sphingomonas quercus]